MAVDLAGISVDHTISGLLRPDTWSGATAMTARRRRQHAFRTSHAGAISASAWGEDPPIR